jgi:hypothetical protein
MPYLKQSHQSLKLYSRPILHERLLGTDVTSIYKHFNAGTNIKLPVFHFTVEGANSESAQTQVDSVNGSASMPPLSLPTHFR